MKHQIEHKHLFPMRLDLSQSIETNGSYICFRDHISPLPIIFNKLEQQVLNQTYAKLFSLCCRHFSD